MIKPFNPKKDVEPYYPAALDIETSQSGNVIGVGFAYCLEGDREYGAFEGWGEWWEFYYPLIEANPKDPALRRIYAHNGANFDWLSFLLWAHKSIGLERVDFIFSGGFGIGANIRIEGHTIRLRDSLRLLPQSLKKLSATFGIEHGKIDLSGELPEETKKRDPARFWHYLKNDCLALQEVVYSFWRLIYDRVGTIGELPMTLPALAVKLWRMTLTEPIQVSWHPEVKEFERRAYTGGRSECYTVGSAKVEVYDANSEYPAVMVAGEYPISYEACWTKQYRGRPGLYHIRYRQDNRLVKPVLRDEESHEFRYEGEGVYTQPEIEKMLAVGGAVLEVIRGRFFYKMGNPFVTFINQWWGFRQEAQEAGDHAFAYVCKILMNSLYGKFGQQETGQAIKLMPYDEMMKRIRDGEKIKILGPFVVVEEERKSEYTFVAIAAYITGYARLHLFAAMEKAQMAGGTLWATDTDSIHVENCPPVKTGSDLGEWKLEYAGNAVYLGKKLYAYEDGTVKAKGIGGEAHDALNYSIMSAIADGTIPFMQVSFTAFPTPREVLSGERPPCVPFTRKRTIQPTVKESPPLLGNGGDQLDYLLNLAFG